MPKNYVIQRDLLDKTDEASNQAYLDRALNISEEELKELLIKHGLLQVKR